MELSHFRALQAAKLVELKRKLTAAYPDAKQRVEHIVSLLIAKLEYLRTTTLADYLLTVSLASREFPEFEELMPDVETVKSLFERSS